MKSVIRDKRKKGTKPHVNIIGNFHKKPDSDKRTPVRFWNFNENHYARDCPHKKGDNIHYIKEATIGDAGKTQRIYVALEGRKADH